VSSHRARCPFFCLGVRREGYDQDIGVLHLLSWGLRNDETGGRLRFSGLLPPRLTAPAEPVIAQCSGACCPRLDHDGFRLTRDEGEKDSPLPNERQGGSL